MKLEEAKSGLMIKIKHLQNAVIDDPPTESNMIRYYREDSESSIAHGHAPPEWCEEIK